MIPNPDFYQIGGCIQPDSETYVERKADDLLFNALTNGNFAYVLAPRQVGKSSLKVKAIKKLEQNNIICISIDLSAISYNNIPTKEWYYTIIYIIGRKFINSEEIKKWWKKHIKEEPNQMLYSFFETITSEFTDKKTVILLDEIDTLIDNTNQTPKFDSFYDTIEKCYKNRNKSNQLHNLNFAIIGTAIETELIQNTQNTLFKNGVAINPEPLKIENSKKLTKGIEHLIADKNKILKEVFAWTGGHPYLTQKLLQSISLTADEITDLESIVKLHVDLQFFNTKQQDANHNINNIENRIQTNKQNKKQTIELWEKVLENQQITFDQTNTAHKQLQISGLIKIETDNTIKPYNKIYTKTFNKKWIQNQKKQT